MSTSLSVVMPVHNEAHLWAVIGWAMVRRIERFLG